MELEKKILDRGRYSDFASGEPQQRSQVGRKVEIFEVGGTTVGVGSR